MAGEREPVPEPEPIRVHRVEWRLGEDGIKELIVDYEGGLAVPELQVKYGLSKGSVRKLLSEAGVSMRRRPLPGSVVKQIIELYETGLSIRQVGVRLDVPKTTVQNTLAKSDVLALGALVLLVRSFLLDRAEGRTFEQQQLAEARLKLATYSTLQAMHAVAQEHDRNLDR